MIKKELIAQVARKTGLTNPVVAQVVDALFQSIQENFENGERTVIKNFGTFSVSSRATRNGVNPGTKEKIVIPARKVAKFSASKRIVIK